MFKNVMRLLPGHFAWVEPNGTMQFTRWRHLRSVIKEHPPIDKPVDWCRETFYHSVCLRMVSDVPVGVLLSGGLDSSSILAALSHLQFQSIETFTVEFSNHFHNEAPLAKRLGERFGYLVNQLLVEDEMLLS
jgi:asparagine synthase (glutamine-hydrolysing)